MDAFLAEDFLCLLACASCSGFRPVRGVSQLYEAFFVHDVGSRNEGNLRRNLRTILKRNLRSYDNRHFHNAGRRKGNRVVLFACNCCIAILGFRLHFINGLCSSISGENIANRHVDRLAKVNNIFRLNLAVVNCVMQGQCLTIFRNIRLLILIQTGLILGIYVRQQRNILVEGLIDTGTIGDICVII